MIISARNTLNLKILQAFTQVNGEMGLRQQKLSTGRFINRAEDDSAGFSIASKLESRIRGQAQALANIEDAKNLLNIKESAFSTVQAILVRMQEKTIQGANDTLGSQERQLINQELQSLANEITSALTNMRYGDVHIDCTTPISVQVGDGPDDVYLIQNEDNLPQTLSLGNFNDGIASWDALTGTGYIMYTEDDIYSRFGANPGIDRADNLVAVVYQGGQWYWSAWHGLTPFTPTASDRLLMSVDFDTDTVTDLAGTDTVVNGIGAGYDTGDLTITANQYGNPPAASSGDFSPSGTQVVVPPPSITQDLTFSPAQLDVSTANSARALLTSIESALELVASQLGNIGDHQKALSLKGNDLSIRSINLSKAHSRIKDADFAKEQIQLVKLQILQDAGVASLAQSVSSYDLVLQLL